MIDLSELITRVEGRHPMSDSRKEGVPPGGERSAGSSRAESGGPYRVLDLFSGVGAYSLGLERTGGFETVAFCEIEPFCRRILHKHWPHVPIYTDVKEVTGDRLRADRVVPDWIVAGWPCQGNSPAGTGLGMDDPRSGLWSEIARLAGELRPQGLLLENSSNLLSINGGRDFGRVLGDLAALGYDAEWHCLSAAAFDAPHIRDRVWIVATLADASWRQPGRQEQRAERKRIGACGQSVSLADTERVGQQGSWKSRNAGDHAPHRERQANRSEHGGQNVALADSLAPVGTAISRQERRCWEPEPGVGRVATGVAHRVDRLHALGNLNPPIIPESIGRAILAAATSDPSARDQQAQAKPPGGNNV